MVSTQIFDKRPHACPYWRGDLTIILRKQCHNLRRVGFRSTNSTVGWGSHQSPKQVDCTLRYHCGIVAFLHIWWMGPTFSLQMKMYSKGKISLLRGVIYHGDHGFLDMADEPNKKDLPSIPTSYYNPANRPALSIGLRGNQPLVKKHGWSQLHRTVQLRQGHLPCRQMS